jgi:hypothetical protein
MTELHVGSALVAKRAELSGEMIAAEKRIAQLRADLGSIDGALRVFDPSISAARIKPVRKRTGPPSLPQGQGNRIIMDTLRRAGEPLTPHETTGFDLRRASGPIGGLGGFVKFGWAGRGAAEASLRERDHCPLARWARAARVIHRRGERM